MSLPGEIHHPAVGTLRFQSECHGEFIYAGEAELDAAHRVAVEFWHYEDDGTPLEEGLAVASKAFGQFRSREANHRRETAELLLPEVHHFFSEDYTADRVAERLSVVRVVLHASGSVTAHYDSGGHFKKGPIAATIGEDGTVEEVEDLN